MAYTAPQRGTKSRQASTAAAATPHRASSPSADTALRATARADRPPRSMTLNSPSFTFESPSAAAPTMAPSAAGAGAALPARKRSKTFETPFDGAADDDAHSKGGHSLRKRARIDYAQVMIDDELGPFPANNNELIVKPATTPSARNRKRKAGHEDSGDDSEDFASNPKRHRVDKSPAPSRALPARRRNTAKKLSADLTAYVDQPSDNEVQDTILVSVPSGPGAPPSEEGSEHSSPRDFEAASPSPSSDNENDEARIQVQPSTPRMRPSTPNKPPAEPVSGAQSTSTLGREDISPMNGVAEDGTADHDVEMPDSAGHGAAPDSNGILAQVSLTGAGETEDSTPVVESYITNTLTLVEPSSTPTPQLDAAVPPPSEPSAQPQNPQPQEERETSQQPTVIAPSVEIPQSPAASAPQPTAAGDASAPSPQETARSPPVSRPASRQGVKSTTGPARLGPLVPIYNAETPFASHLNLAPYHDETTALPGPFTEWVHPVAPLVEQSTPVVAPTPALSPIEKPKSEVEWDPTRRLKTSEFFALWRKEKKRRQEKGEPPISLAKFNNECVRRYKAAHSEDVPLVTPSSTPESSDTRTVVAGRQSDPLAPLAQDDGARESQAPESRLPTAAPSPAPLEEPTPQDDGAEDEQDADEGADDQTKPDSPGEPIEVTRQPQKQYLFPKIRDANEFVEAFEGYQDFTTEHLYDVVAAGVEALNAWQQEYAELKKILDDEENAKRRRAHDRTLVNWENRQKADEPPPPRRHFDDVGKGPTAFEIRGARAPKPYLDDPLLERQKDEDRIMAQAYGFKHNTHPTQVGRQNPEEQRWEMPENRLRRRTEKGAELAEENVVEGKRVRKPRHVSDQSKDPSRAGTPSGIAALGTGRRPRRRGAAAVDDIEGPDQGQFADSFSESPRKGRAARTRATLLSEGQQLAGNELADEDEMEVDEKPKPSRRRGRGAALPEPPTSVPVGVSGEATTKPKRGRAAKGQQGQNSLGTGEIATSSFYSNVSTQPDSRPSTASSEQSSQTAETMESTYSLREKRKRNFAIENDPELETRPARRARGAAAQKQDAPEPKKRASRKKEPAAPPPLPPAPAPTPPTLTPAPVLLPPQVGPPLLQPPAPAPLFHNFVAGPMMDVGHGPQPVPSYTGAGPTPFLHTFTAAPSFSAGVPPPQAQPPSAKKPITKIKVTNNGTGSQASSRAQTPTNGTSGSKTGAKRSRGNKGGAAAEAKGAAAGANGGGDLDKPYAEMTKSEKMSWSMRSKFRAVFCFRLLEGHANKTKDDGPQERCKGPSRSGVRRSLSRRPRKQPATGTQTAPTPTTWAAWDI